MAKFALKAVGDMIAGVVMKRNDDDDVVVSYIPTPRNVRIMQAIMQGGTFRPPRWLAGPHIQTAMACTLGGLFEFEREMVRLSDGVDVAIDVKAPDGLPLDAPIVFFCHGLGGSARNGMIVRLSDLAAARGWRSVVYIRGGQPAPLTPSAPAGSQRMHPRQPTTP